MTRFAYSSISMPPTLLAPVVVAGTEISLVQEVDGLLDTGADISLIPMMIRQALGLKPVTLVTVHGARKEKSEGVPIFQVRLRVAGSDWIETMAVEAVKPHMTLGRDVINRLILTAHGPEGWFELALPGTPKS